MKKILLFALMMIAGALSSYAIFDKYTIDRDQLPEAAQEMLDTYFPKAKVSMIKVDKHLLKKTDYDVKLTNGVEIEFSNAGKWTSVDCGTKAVPADIIPKAVNRYVSKNHSTAKIVKIKKTSTAYEITLSDGQRLKFSLLGQFKQLLPPEDE